MGWPPLRYAGENADTCMPPCSQTGVAGLTGATTLPVAGVGVTRT